MKKLVCRELNEIALLYCCEKLDELDYIVGWGTLLGLVREGRLLDYDDDIDFYVNIKLRDIVIEVFKDSRLYIDGDHYINQTPFFLMGKFNHDEEETESQVDFYFFKDDPKLTFIEDRWNSSPYHFMDPKKWIYIPKNIVFPISEKYFFGQRIKFPHDHEGACEYFYGDGWKLPLKKGSQYETIIFDNKPKVIKISLIRRALRLFSRILRFSKIS